MGETTTEGPVGRESIPRPGLACNRAAAATNCATAQFVSELKFLQFFSQLAEPYLELVRKSGSMLSSWTYLDQLRSAEAFEGFYDFDRSHK